MKEMITVQLSFKRCRGELQMDKGREEKHARKRGTDKGRELWQGVSLSGWWGNYWYHLLTFCEVIWGQKTAIQLRMPGELCRSSKSWWIYVFWTECPHFLTDSLNADLKSNKEPRTLVWTQWGWQKGQGSLGWRGSGSDEWWHPALESRTPFLSWIKLTEVRHILFWFPLMKYENKFCS